MNIATAVAADQDATSPAARRLRCRLDHHVHPAALLDDLDDVEPVQADEQIAAVAVGVSAGIGT